MREPSGPWQGAKGRGVERLLQWNQGGWLVRLGAGGLGRGWTPWGGLKGAMGFGHVWVSHTALPSWGALWGLPRGLTDEEGCVGRGPARV